MPKLKLAKKPRIPENLVANIRWIMGRYGLDEEDIALAIGGCRATYYNRMRRPEKFTLEELAGIAEKSGVDLQVLQFGQIKLDQDIAV